jgi:hypothetical protein
MEEIAENMKVDNYCYIVLLTICLYCIVVSVSKMSDNVCVDHYGAFQMEAWKREKNFNFLYQSLIIKNHLRTFIIISRIKISHSAT